MTIPSIDDLQPVRRRGADLGAVRELLAVLLLLIGLVGLGVAAFATDLWAGVAYVSALFVALGAYLGTER